LSEVDCQFVLILPPRVYRDRSRHRLKARKIKLAECSQILPPDHLSYLAITPALERDAARQRGGGQPTVLCPALLAADKSGRGSLGSGRRSWFGFSANFNGLNFLSNSTSLEGVTLDAFLRGEGQRTFQCFSCDLPPPPDFSFASVGGGARRLTILSKYAEPSYQIRVAQIQSEVIFHL
jgi:hypothetical protein